MKPEHKKIIPPHTAEILNRPYEPEKFEEQKAPAAFDWSRPFKTKSGLVVTMAGNLPYASHGPFYKVGIVSVPHADDGEFRRFHDHLTRWHNSGANIEKREWSLINVPQQFTYTVFILSDGGRKVETLTFEGVHVVLPDDLRKWKTIARHTFTVKEGEFSA